MGCVRPVTDTRDTRRDAAIVPETPAARQRTSSGLIQYEHGGRAASQVCVRRLQPQLCSRSVTIIEFALELVLAFASKQISSDGSIQACLYV